MITWKSVIGARFTAVCPFDYASGLAMGRKFATCLGLQRIEDVRYVIYVIFLRRAPGIMKKNGSPSFVRDSLRSIFVW